MGAASTLFPPARVVWGSMYKPRTTNFDGSPLVFKDGPNKGQPTQRFEFGVAIPKRGEQHWSQTPWGAPIWATGHQAFPNGAAQRPDFAWKVIDGDSNIPNKNGKVPNQQTGYPGHWVLTFSSSYPPKLYKTTGPNQVAQITEPDAIKCGFWVEVYGSVASNNTPSNPGVFLNHDMVCLAGYDEEIHTGADPKSVGFGGAQLPPNVSTTPVGGFAPPAAPGYPQPPQGYAPAAAPVPPQYAAPAAPQYQQPAAQPQYQQPAAPVQYAPAPPPAQAAYAPPPQGQQYQQPAPPPGQPAYAAPAPAGYAPPPAYGAPAGVVPVPSFLNGPQ